MEDEKEKEKVRGYSTGGIVTSAIVTSVMVTSEYEARHRAAAPYNPDSTAAREPAMEFCFSPEQEALRATVHRFHVIGEGTSEIQRNIIARDLDL